MERGMALLRVNANAEMGGEHEVTRCLLKALVKLFLGLLVVASLEAWHVGMPFILATYHFLELLDHIVSFVLLP